MLFVNSVNDVYKKVMIMDSSDGVRNLVDMPELKKYLELGLDIKGAHLVGGSVSVEEYFSDSHITKLLLVRGKPVQGYTRGQGIITAKEDNIAVIKFPDGYDSRKYIDIAGFSCATTVDRLIDLSGVDYIIAVGHLGESARRLFSNLRVRGLDLSRLDISSVVDAREMFDFCSHLHYLDLSTWTMSSMYHTDHMFKRCNVVDIEYPHGICGLNSSTIKSFR